jgi:hypothetical protein
MGPPVERGRIVLPFRRRLGGRRQEENGDRREKPPPPHERDARPVVLGLQPVRANARRLLRAMAAVRSVALRLWQLTWAGPPRWTGPRPSRLAVAIAPDDSYPASNRSNTSNLIGGSAGSTHGSLKLLAGWTTLHSKGTLRTPIAWTVTFPPASMRSRKKCL